MPEQPIPENIVFRYPKSASEKRKAEIKAEGLDDLKRGLDIPKLPELQREIPFEEWQKEILTKVNELVADFFRSEIGLNIGTIDLSHIHILKPEDLSSALKIPANRARGAQRAGHIFLSSDLNKADFPKVEFSKVLIHEILHSKIFLKIAEIIVTKYWQQVKVVAPERQGLTILKRKEYPPQHHFSGVDEGLTEILRKKIYHHLINEVPSLKEEQEQKFAPIDTKISRDELFKVRGINSYDIEDIKVERDGQDTHYEWKEKGAYLAEQDLIQFVSSGIARANHAKYKNPSQAINLFFKAQYKGELSPLIKAIDRTFGKGSSRVIAAVMPWHEGGQNPQARNAIQFLRLPPSRRDPNIAMQYLFDGHSDDFSKWLKSQEKN